MLTELYSASDIYTSPTTPHTSQENGVAERYNRTLLSRLRSTLHEAKISFDQYWDWAVLDAASKTNSTLHDTIKDIPKRVWLIHAHPRSPFTQSRTNLQLLRPFAEVAHIANVRSNNKKSDLRGALVRYLQTVDDDNYRVLHPQ